MRATLVRSDIRGALRPSTLAQCLCCFLRPGIVTLALLSFINACFCFAGEGALLLGSGLASGITESAGSVLPAGAPLSGNTAAHGGLVFTGVYMLFVRRSTRL